MHPLVEEEHKGFNISVFQDADAESPNEWGDNSAFIVAFSSSQFWQVREGLKTPEDVEDWHATHYVYNLYAYIHSGITLSLSEFSCVWDSGQIGYVIVTKDENDIPFPEKCAEGLVESWNQYLSGQVYSYKVEDNEGNLQDSLHGIYANEETVLAEARAAADWQKEKAEA